MSEKHAFDIHVVWDRAAQTVAVDLGFDPKIEAAAFVHAAANILAAMVTGGFNTGGVLLVDQLLKQFVSVLFNRLEVGIIPDVTQLLVSKLVGQVGEHFRPWPTS